MEAQDYLQYFIELRLEVMIWLIAANAVFAASLTRRSRFPLRAGISLALNLLLATGVGVLSFIILNANIQGGHESRELFPIMNVVAHAIFFFATVIALRFCYEEKPNICLFCAIAGYALNNAASVVIDWLMAPLGTSLASGTLNGDYYYLIINIAFHTAFYICMFFLLRRSVKDIPEAAEINKYPTQFLFMAVLLVDIVVRSYASFFRHEAHVMHSILQLSVLSGSLIILFVQFYITRQFLEAQKKEVLLHISQQHAEQYKVTKEMIDIINIKSHDLKHQLMALQSKGAVDPEYIAELSESVSTYDAAAATGNDALDTVLTEKSLFCAKNNIQLTYIASGKDLSFLSVSDIYSLFGNALDNAIEYVLTLAEEKRIIKLFAGRRDSFVRVTVSNYFEGKPPEMVDGLPQTTKGDTAYHGYGMRSIKEIAERYGGDMTVVVEGSLFTVSILFPTKAEMSDMR